jgi:hypothetical protein
MSLFGLFAPKCPIPDYEWEWMLACLRWLEEEFPREGVAIGVSPLVLPNDENFPRISDDFDARAKQLFERTKELAELTDWPTELIGYENISNAQLISPHMMGEDKWSDAAGTFQLIPDATHGWIARISYDIGQLRDPSGFVATMAHELAHYLMSTAKRCPPGGWDLHELATDMTAIWMGFGIFLANNAKSFESFTDHDRQGWQARTNGYLNERAILTGMALCVSLRGDNPAEAIPHLKPYLVKGYKLAISFIEQTDITKAFRDTDLADFGVEEVSEA